MWSGLIENQIVVTQSRFAPFQYDIIWLVQRRYIDFCLHILLSYLTKYSRVLCVCFRSTDRQTRQIYSHRQMTFIYREKYFSRIVFLKHDCVINTAVTISHVLGKNDYRGRFCFCYITEYGRKPWASCKVYARKYDKSLRMTAQSMYVDFFSSFRLLGNKAVLISLIGTLLFCGI